MAIKEKVDMVRFKTEKERNKQYISWVRKNGLPTKNQGCINCAMLVCLDDCLGIHDPRILRMDQLGDLKL